MKKLLLSLAFIGFAGCATAKADAKADLAAIISCAKVDPSNAQLKASAEQCIARTVSGSYADCLKDLMPLASWSESEIACVASKTAPK